MFPTPSRSRPANSKKLTAFRCLIDAWIEGDEPLEMFFKTVVAGDIVNAVWDSTEILPAKYAAVFGLPPGCAYLTAARHIGGLVVEHGIRTGFLRFLPRKSN